MPHAKTVGIVDRSKGKSSGIHMNWPPRKRLFVTSDVDYAGIDFQNLQNPEAVLAVNHRTQITRREIARNVAGGKPSVNCAAQRFHKSSGRSPVSLAILANAAGPISSLSWKQNVKLRQPSRCNLRCEPTCFLSVQPSRKRAVYTRRALVARQTLKRRRGPSAAREHPHRSRSYSPIPVRLST